MEFCPLCSSLLIDGKCTNKTTRCENGSKKPKITCSPGFLINRKKGIMIDKETGTRVNITPKGGEKSVSKLLEEAVDIGEVDQRNLWVLYGKSGSGKTHLGSTFPKPMLYLQVGDDGANTIKNVEGIKTIPVRGLEHLKNLTEELMRDKVYKAVFVDTFSLIVNDWVDENAVQKKKRMTQQMWGDLKSDTEELTKRLWALSKNKIVILSCHEGTDAFEGLEDEIMPDIRPNVSRGARTYLEAMANYGIHTTIVKKTLDDGKEVFKHACHLASNPYYWVKLQKPAEVVVPKIMINPTYTKIMSKLEGEK